METQTYTAALAGVRALIDQFAGFASNEIDSTELKLRTREAAKAACAANVPFTALCADLGRVAAESLGNDRLTALRLGRAMARWSAPIFRIDEPLL
jgi:hypothetical protein